MHGGLQFGAFTLVAPVGAGASGEVWRARHVDTGVHAAVKLLHEITDPAWEREVDAIGRIRHPGLVPLYDAGRDHGVPWVASGWMSQGTVRQRPPADWDGLRELLLSTLDALCFLHASGVLHRDLKPENILRDADRWHLADFGIVRFMAEVSAAVPRGTPWYVAPEQIRGDAHAQRPWTDLYAVACMGWELATGLPPYDGTLVEILRAHQQGRPGAFHPRFPVPEGFEAWLRVLLRKEGQRRAMFAADAAHALASLGPPTGTGSAPGTGGDDAITFDLSQVDTVGIRDPGGGTVPDHDEAPLPAAPIPERPPLNYRPALPEQRIGPLLRLENPIVPIPELFDPLWDRMRAAHRSDRAVVLTHPDDATARLRTTWVMMWAAAFGIPGASLPYPPGVRVWLGHLVRTDGARPLADNVRAWAGCGPDEADAVAAALDPDAPYDPELLARFLGWVARGRGLVVDLRRIDEDPERPAFAAAIARLDAPVFCVASGHGAVAVDGADPLAPVPLSEGRVAAWLRDAAPIDAALATELARGRGPGQAWLALRDRLGVGGDRS